MPRPNLPASAADISRLVARVERLERAYRAAGARTFGELDDVDAIDPADGSVATYVEATGKIQLAPNGAGFPITLDDGTATYTISIPTPGELQIETSLDADPSIVTKLQQIVTGSGSSAVLSAQGGGNIGLTINSPLVGIPNILIVDGSHAVQVNIGTGDPNGIVAALSPGSLYIDDTLTTPAVWINTDGGTTWSKVGP